MFTKSVNYFPVALYSNNPFIIFLLFYLHRALTAQFPQEKPIVTVTPAVTHPWVEPGTYRVTGCPGINNVSK
jgi:hypothetical protein